MGSPDLVMLSGTGSVSVPLVLLFAVGMLKGFFEHYQRKLDDRRVNEQLVDVHTSSHSFPITIHWKDLRVGNIVRLSENQPVPADLILINQQ